jgi:hypothetical protein
MNGITPHDQQGNKKNDDTKEMFHGVSEVGHFERASLTLCTRLYEVGGSDAEHPSRKALAGFRS